MKHKPLWEILVPCVHGEAEPRTSNGNPVKVRHHKVWDAKVREICGGLTIMKPARGEWVSEDDQLYQERMIPVRIMASENEVKKIAEFTIKHYNQLAVMYYKVTEDCYVMERQ